MIRFLLILGIAYFIYRALKSLMSQSTSHRRHVSGKTSGEIDDVMLKDPYCDTYFAKREGVYIYFRGKDLYFCSPDCRDKYIAGHLESKNQRS